MEAVPGSNPGERPGRRGSVPPSSALEGAPPARQRALNTRDGVAAVRLDTSIFLASGTAQLVEGAALIQRYRQVRSLGARPGSIPSAL
jgi:hypothetical protein